MNTNFDVFRNRMKKKKRKKKRAFSLKIKTVNLIKRKSTIRHTLSGSIEFALYDWKIGEKGVRSKSNFSKEAELKEKERKEIDITKLKIMHVIGEGGQSQVRFCEYLGKNYAIKMVYLEEEKYEYSSSSKEIDLLRSIKHSKIVKMHQAFFKDKRICLLLEYMDCGTLKNAVTKNGPIKTRILSLITYQMLEGLIYLHNNGILHRDIKPSNYLISSKGKVKLSDFGFAKRLNKQGNVSPTLSGTNQYKSPQCFQYKKCTIKCDIWALGLTVAYCALGKFPFTNTHDEFFKNLKTGEFFNSLKNQVSEELFEFLVGACSLDDSTRKTAPELMNSRFIQKYNNLYNFDRKKLIREWAQSNNLLLNTKMEDEDVVMKESNDFQVNPSKYFEIKSTED